MQVTLGLKRVGKQNNREVLCCSYLAHGVRFEGKCFLC